jgi:hypothetical protein
MRETDTAVNAGLVTQRGDFAITLHIEELVLHSFATRDRHAITAALERELARLLTAEGVPTGLTHMENVSRLDGGSFNMSHGATPDVIGAQLAHAVYHSLAGSSGASTTPGGGNR